MSYSYGNVKPWVRAAGDEVGPKFGVSNIGGFGLRSDLQSDHPKGLALDFMVGGDKAKGDAVASYVLANASRLGVKYVIWYQRIWDVARGDKAWRNMANRGSATANHRDHVHVSFIATAPTGGSIVDVNWNPATGFFDPTDPIGSLNDVLDGVRKTLTVVMDIQKAMLFLANPHNWLRVGMGVSGAMLVGIALYQLSKGSGVANTITSVPGAIKSTTKQAQSLAKTGA